MLDRRDFIATEQRRPEVGVGMTGLVADASKLKHGLHSCFLSALLHLVVI